MDQKVEQLRDNLRSAVTEDEIRGALEKAGEWVDANHDHADLEALLATIHVSEMQLASH